MHLSDRFLLAPAAVPGRPNHQWRAVLNPNGRRRIERRESSAAEWEKVSVGAIINEILLGSEAGRWLKRLADAGHLD